MRFVDCISWFKNKNIMNLLQKIKTFFSLRNIILTGVYSFIVVVAFYMSLFLRFDFDLDNVAYHGRNHLYTILLILCVNLSSLYVFGQYKAFLAFFYMRDLFLLVWSQIFAFSILFVLMIFFPLFAFPRGAQLICFILTLSGLGIMRVGLRLVRERLYVRNQENNSFTKSRVAILGAGNLGASLVSDLLSKSHLGVEPVILLDDDPSKVGKRVAGIEIVAVPKDFTMLKHRYLIDRAIIATSKISSTRLSEITTALRKVGISALIQPSYFDFAVGRTKLAPVRQVNVLDVLGRNPVDLNDAFIGESLRGKVVMVTGAGGSIGSELCRQIAMRKVDMLILVEHCEVQLFKIEQDLKSCKFGVPIIPLVANVCDSARMEYLIKRFKPQIIFHAAAHKHVPLMEYQPSEALKNNVLGTWTVADLASRCGVEKFLLISTDKAVNPTNVMGASKRFAELVVQSMQNRLDNKTRFVAVRFGNVLGSSGSVIPTFKKQIEAGGPVTLTHPDVTRYFMTIPEAVGLVLQCGAQANGGEILVLDMGEPIKIIDLARRMISLSGFEPDKDINIEIIGLRPGEKLYEELQNKDERLVRTEHDRIFCFSCMPEKYEDIYEYVKKIRDISDSTSVNDLKRFLCEVVPEYRVQYYE